MLFKTCHSVEGRSSQAKGTNSTSFLTHEVELVPLACEDVEGP